MCVAAGGSQVGGAGQRERRRHPRGGQARRADRGSGTLDRSGGAARGRRRRERRPGWANIGKQRGAGAAGGAGARRQRPGRWWCRRDAGGALSDASDTGAERRARPSSTDADRWRGRKAEATATARSVIDCGAGRHLRNSMVHLPLPGPLAESPAGQHDPSWIAAGGDRLQQGPPVATSPARIPSPARE